MRSEDEFIRSILDRISFKPTTRFEYKDGTLIVWDTFPDYCFGDEEVKEYAYYSSDTVDISGLSEADATKVVVDWVYKTVIMSEVHEISENFKLDEIAVYFPHIKSTVLNIEPPFSFVPENHITIMKESWKQAMDANETSS
jgi:hypothetical protein